MLPQGRKVTKHGAAVSRVISIDMTVIAVRAMLLFSVHILEQKRSHVFQSLHFISSTVGQTVCQQIVNLLLMPFLRATAVPAGTAESAY